MAALREQLAAVTKERDALAAQAGANQQQPASAAAVASGGGGPVGSTAEAAFSGAYTQQWGYAPSLTEGHLQKGIVSHGAPARTRRLLRRLLAGESITVAVVGGSVTWGKVVKQRGVDDWGSLLSSWVQQSFPKATIKFVNG